MTDQRAFRMVDAGNALCRPNLVSSRVTLQELLQRHASQRQILAARDGGERLATESFPLDAFQVEMICDAIGWSQGVGATEEMSQAQRNWAAAEFIAAACRADPGVGASAVGVVMCAIRYGVFDAGEGPDTPGAEVTVAETRSRDGNCLPVVFCVGRRYLGSEFLVVDPWAPIAMSSFGTESRAAFILGGTSVGPVGRSSAVAYEADPLATALWSQTFGRRAEVFGAASEFARMRAGVFAHLREEPC